jgi:chromosomal replication initiation ATPase DnaA
MSPTRQRIDEIFRTACEMFGVDMRLLVTKKNPGRAAYNARIICIKSLRDSTNLVLSDIGNLFDTDHTCICYALNRYEVYYSNDQFFRIDADFFKTQI